MDEQKKFLMQVFMGIGIVLTFLQLATTAEMTKEVLAMNVGFFIGVFSKVIIPYLRKIQEGKVDGFQVKYLWTAITTFFYMLPINHGILTTMNLTGLHWSACAFLGLMVGIGSNWTTEEVYKFANFLVDYYRNLARSSQESHPSSEVSDNSDMPDFNVISTLNTLDKLTEETQAEKEAQEAIEEIAEQSIEEQKEEGVM